MEMIMKKYVKEVWVKFDSRNDYSENEEKLFEILDKAPGDCVVKVYDASTRECKTLSGHRFDNKQLSLLTDFLGEDNAKYQEREIEVQQPKPLKVPKILQIIPCNHDMYAVYNCDNGEKYKSKVLMYALCDDGEIYPLCFDNWLGICSLVGAVYDVDGYELEGGEIWQDGGSRMNKNKIISLADAPGCPAAVTAFYDRYRERITGIESVEQRNNILSEMQQDFETEVRQEPQDRDKLSEVYQLLKRKCWEVGLCGNG